MSVLVAEARGVPVTFEELRDLVFRGHPQPEAVAEIVIEGWLTLQDAEAWYGSTASEPIEQAVKRGDLRPVQLGGVAFVSEADAIAWWNEHAESVEELAARPLPKWEVPA